MLYEDYKMWMAQTVDFHDGPLQFGQGGNLCFSLLSYTNSVTRVVQFPEHTRTLLLNEALIPITCCDNLHVFCENVHVNSENLHVERDNGVCDLALTIPYYS